MKRAGLPRPVEVVLAGCVLLVTAPLWLLASAAIALTSSGGILFRQQRVGQNGTRFTLYKLRTMDADRTGPGITVSNDARVTAIGRVLRKLKLDELPALWNVVRGDMSLVGPRPEVPQYVDAGDPLWQAVLSVPPGVTDPVTIRLRNEEELLATRADDSERFYRTTLQPFKLRGSRDYLASRSWVTDFAVLWRSVLVVIAPGSIRLPSPREIEGGAESSPGTGGARGWTRVVLAWRRPAIVGLHLALATLANYLAFWLRFDGAVPPTQILLLQQTLPALLVIRGAMLFPFRLYQGLWRYASIPELGNIVASVGSSSLLFFAVVRWGFGVTTYPRSVFVIDAILMVVFAGGIRLAHRVRRELLPVTRQRRVLVFGAGDAGEAIVRDMQRHTFHDYEPLGFIDDDETKVGQRIHGVPVLGTRKDLPTIMRQLRPHEILITIPRAEPSTYRAVVRALEDFKVPITTLPNLRDLLSGKVTVNQIRSLAVEDLLQRAPVGLSAEPLRRLVDGQSVMVTGAGGSIGSELCKQIAALNPAGLILYERYENSLYDVVNDLADDFPAVKDRVHAAIGDVTDRGRLDAIMTEHRPAIVFHAAAHKHVPLMEQNACEAVKNNVLGTRLVAEVASQHAVDRVILISSDKAVNPSSVMGATKRVAELMLQVNGGGNGTSFFTVRFGNVLGSNGSVVPRFVEQIKKGGPLTVTHPEIRRYFMSIPEAVQLVLHTAAHGQAGCIYVLEMGEPIKLVDLARDLIRLSGLGPDEIPIAFVGLRPGEKLHEELVGENESVQPSSVDKVLQVAPRALPEPEWLTQHIRLLERSAVRGDSAAVMEGLSVVVPGFGADREEPEPISEPDTAPVGVEDRQPVAEPPPHPVAVAGLTCPSCTASAVYRSRARGRAEMLRKRVTEKRVYRCHECGWRGWLTVVEDVAPLPAAAPVDVPDFDSIDAVIRATVSSSTVALAPHQLRVPLQG